MYDVDLFDEARATAGALPHLALKVLADFVDLLTLDPSAGRPYRGPDSDLRTVTLSEGRLLVVWLVLEEQRRVEILRIMWLGD